MPAVCIEMQTRYYYIDIILSLKLRLNYQLKVEKKINFTNVASLKVLDIK